MTPANISGSIRSSSCLSMTSTLPATDINHLTDDTNNYLAQSAGAVEYTDCTSGYDTKQSDGEVPAVL